MLRNSSRGDSGRMGDSEMIAYVQVDALTRVSGPTDRCESSERARESNPRPIRWTAKRISNGVGTPFSIIFHLRAAS